MKSTHDGGPAADSRSAQMPHCSILELEGYHPHVFL